MMLVNRYEIYWR